MRRPITPPRLQMAQAQWTRTRCPAFSPEKKKFVNLSSEPQGGVFSLLHSSESADLHLETPPLSRFRPAEPLPAGFPPWRRVRSENRRRLTSRCSGRWLACPRIGNALTVTNAARPMSTWQWVPSSAPPAPGSCECPFCLYARLVVVCRPARWGRWMEVRYR